MPRKQNSIHYIYKTTCNVTDRYYIGMHSTSNINDGYLGSGIVLRRSIRKYGKENHTKEILEFLNTKEELIESEKKYITPEMVSDRNCMNLVSGGDGWTIEHNNAFKEKLKNLEYKASHSKKMSIVQKKAFKTHSSRQKFILNWSGRTHSEETKKLMSEVKQKSGTGKANSQYGTCWITNGTENKKIKIEEQQKYFSNEWVLGRTIH